jgi:hypothetical protein
MMNHARKRAAQAGQTRYQGGPCKTCKNTERFTANGNCSTCQFEHNAFYQRKIQELLKAAKAMNKLEVIVVGDDK